jgi:hypothetical protein
MLSKILKWLQIPVCAKDVLFQIDIEKVLKHKYDNVRTALIALEGIDEIIVNFNSTKENVLVYA